MIEQIADALVIAWWVFALSVTLLAWLRVPASR